MRTAAILVMAGLSHAGSGIELFEMDRNLWPEGVEVALEKPAAEVRLVFAFKSGLGTLGERGTAALASARFVVEYNDADRQTCYWNQYRPVPFDAEANAGWSGHDEAPGLFVTEGSSSSLVERTLAIRLPRVNRWRVRVTPLEGSDGAVAREATLVLVAEMRDASPRRFEEKDPLLPWEEVEVPAEAEEAEPLPEDEFVEEEQVDAAAWTTVESVGGTTIRAIQAGAVPTGYAYTQANRAARSRACGGNNARAAARQNAMPWWQPPVALQPTRAVIPYPQPVAAPTKAPPWGAPLPFWAVPKPKPAAPARGAAKR